MYVSGPPAVELHQTTGCGDLRVSEYTDATEPRIATEASAPILGAEPFEMDDGRRAPPGLRATAFASTQQSRTTTTALLRFVRCERQARPAMHP
jgi:hypothetical protein